MKGDKGRGSEVAGMREERGVESCKSHVTDRGRGKRM